MICSLKMNKIPLKIWINLPFASKWALSIALTHNAPLTALRWRQLLVGFCQVNNLIIYIPLSLFLYLSLGLFLTLSQVSRSCQLCCVVSVALCCVEEVWNRIASSCCLNLSPTEALKLFTYSPHTHMICMRGNFECLQCRRVASASHKHVILYFFTVW